MAPCAGDCVLAVPADVRNNKRDKTKPHFLRDDGAWFDFAITLVGDDVVAYSFEIRSVPGLNVPWIRFDLNPPDHTNADRGLRAHVHLGSDDDGLSIPYRACEPEELLDLLIDGLRQQRRQRNVMR